jgi:hypothetical protein
MITIDQLALGFGFDADVLKGRLNFVADQHSEQKRKYEIDVSESEGRDLFRDISSRSKQLFRVLDSLPEYIKSEFEMRCVKKTIKDPLGKEDDISFAYGDDFIDETIKRLKEISRVASSTRIRKIGQKKMFHRNWLLRELRVIWTDLDGSPPSKSSADNRFIDFMEQVCDYLEIDKSGLSRKHFNL